jgi:hypothetical protein
MSNTPTVNKPFEVLHVTIYSGALLVAALLMFFIEPFIAKLLLPVLGGGPGIWNTCVLFFQTILLLGYLYSHILSTYVKPRWQLVIHLPLVWASVLLLPIQLSVSATPTDSLLSPVGWLFLTLSAMVGGVFFSISTTAPLLQRWFALSRFSVSSDPYFLFAASNFGGLVGLLSYPFLIEPNLTLQQQAQYLSLGYIVFAALVSLAGISIFRSSTKKAIEVETVDLKSVRPKTFDYLVWLLMSAIPSSLVLGLTEHVSAELSAIPLFWIVPLSLYLLSFIVAFGRFPVSIIKVSTWLAPLMVAMSVLIVSSENVYLMLGGDEYIYTGISVQLLTLLALCLACHGKLAAERPSSEHLTVFYFTLSLGGVVGSSFNTLVAPLVFKSGHEYSIVLMCAAILLARLPKDLCRWKLGDGKLFDVYVPAVVLFVSALSWFAYSASRGGVEESYASFRPEWGAFEIILRLVLPVACCMLLARSNRQYRLGLLSLCAIVLMHYQKEDSKSVVYRERNFFGRVSVATYEDTVELWNGANLHGTECLNPLLRGRPEAYLYTDGPIGLLLDELNERANVNSSTESGASELEKRRLYVSSMENASKDLPPIAVMGLGCGVAAALVKTGQRLVFYEINPQVEEIAANPFFFTYIYEAKKRDAKIRVVTGDARVSIQREAANTYRMIIGDAFNASSIPTHLVTKEAIEIYLRKLRQEGVLAFNTTGYYDLRPVLSRAASELGLHALTIREYDRTSRERDYIEWIVLARDARLAQWLQMQGWKPLKSNPNFRLWTDDYSNPLKVMKNRFS